MRDFLKRFLAGFLISGQLGLPVFASPQADLSLSYYESFLIPYYKNSKAPHSRNPSANRELFELDPPQGPATDPELQKKVNRLTNDLDNYRYLIMGDETQQQGGIMGALGGAMGGGPEKPKSGLLQEIADRFGSIKYDNNFRTQRPDPSANDKKTREMLDRGLAHKKEVEALLINTKISQPDRYKILLAYSHGVIIPVRNLIWILGHRNFENPSLKPYQMQNYMVSLPVDILPPLKQDENPPEKPDAEKQKEFEKIIAQGEKNLRVLEKEPSLKGLELGIETLSPLLPPLTPAPDDLEFLVAKESAQLAKANRTQKELQKAIEKDPRLKGLDTPANTPGPKLPPLLLSDQVDKNEVLEEALEKGLLKPTPQTQNPIRARRKEELDKLPNAKDYPLVDDKQTEIGISVEWPSKKSKMGRTRLTQDGKGLTQPYLENLKVAKTPYTYVQSLKAMAIQSHLLQQIALSQITGDAFPINIPESCQTGMFEGFPTWVSSGASSPEAQLTLIDQILETQGLIAGNSDIQHIKFLEDIAAKAAASKTAGSTENVDLPDNIFDDPSTPTPPAPTPAPTPVAEKPAEVPAAPEIVSGNPQTPGQQPDQNIKDKILDRISVPTAIVRGGIKIKDPYGPTPFESLRAAQWGNNKKRDQRLDPALDDFADFEVAFDQKAMEGREYLGSLGLKSKIGPLFNRISRDLVVFDTNSNAEVKSLKNWPEYLIEALLRKPELNGDAIALMCPKGKNYLERSKIVMPTPFLRGPPEYRDWALETLGRKLRDFAAVGDDPKYKKAFHLLEDTPTFCEDGLCDNGVVEGVQKLSKLLLYGNKSSPKFGQGTENKTPVQFIPFYDLSHIEALMPYEAQIASAWSFLIKMKWLGENEGVLISEWDYLTDDFFEEYANPWKRFRFALVHAALCTDDYPIELTAQDKKLLYFDWSTREIDGRVSPLKFPALKLGLMGPGNCPDQNDPILCALDKGKVRPYHANRILSSQEKKAIWKSKVDKANDDENLTVFSTPVKNPNTKSKVFLDEFESLFRNPLILTESDFNKAVRKFQLQGPGGFLSRKINKEFSEQVATISESDSGKIAKAFSAIYSARGNLQSQIKIFEDLKKQNPEKFGNLSSENIQKHFVITDQSFRRILNRELLKKAAFTRREKLNSTLKTLCDLKPGELDVKNEQFRQIVVNTFKSQVKLNKLWGIENIPDQVMNIFNDDDYPWSTILKYAGGYLGIAAATGGCLIASASTGGLASGLCAPLFALVTAGVAAKQQVDLIIYELEQVKLGQDRIFKSEAFKDLGFTDDEGQGIAKVHGYFDLYLEFITGFPILSVGTKFAGAGVRRLAQMERSVGALRVGMITPKQAFKEVVFGTKLGGRESNLAEGLGHLGLIRWWNSLFSSAVVREKIAKSTKGQISTDFGSGLAYVFDNKFSVFRKHLQQYSNPHRLLAADRNLDAYKGFENMGIKRRILTLGGFQGIRDFWANRASKRMIFGKKIEDLFRDMSLAEQNGKTLTEFFTENADDISDLIYRNPYMFRDGLSEALIQSGGTVEQFETIVTLGFNQVARNQLRNRGTMNTVAGMVNNYGPHKWAPTSEMSRSLLARRLALTYQHITFEQYRIQAQKVLGLGDQMNFHKTFDVVQGFRVKSAELLQKMQQSGNPADLFDLMKSMEGFETKSAQKIARAWSQKGDEAADLKQLFKPENADQLRKILFGPSTGQELAIAERLWAKVNPSEIFEIGELEEAAHLTLKYLSKFDETSEYNGLISALKVLSFSKAPPSHLF